MSEEPIDITGALQKIESNIGMISTDFIMGIDHRGISDKGHMEMLRECGELIQAIRDQTPSCLHLHEGKGDWAEPKSSVDDIMEASKILHQITRKDDDQ